MADNPNIKVTADTSQATSALDRFASKMSSISKSVQGLGSNMGTVGQKIQNFGDNLYSMGSKLSIAVTAPIAAIGKSMIQQGSDLASFEATYTQVMGGMATAANTWAKNYASEIGATTTQVRQQIMAFDQYSRSLGMTSTEALDFSEKLTYLTDDLAAMYNVDPAEATDRMKSALMGNYEAVDKLGISLGESTIKMEMAKEGLKGQFSELQPTTQMWLLYNISVKQAAQSHDQAKREANQYQAQMNKIKGTLQELAYKVFTILLPQIQEFLNKITKLVTWLKSLSPEQIKFYANILKWAMILPPVIMWLGIMIMAIGRIYKALASVVKFIGKLSDLEKIALRIVSAWNKVATFFSTFGSTLGNIIVGALEGIAGAVGLPVGAIIAIIVGIIIVVFLVIKYWDKIKAVAIKVWDTVAKFLKGVWNSISGTASSIWGGIADFFKGVWDKIVNIFNTYILPIINVVVKVFTTVGNVISSFVSGVLAVLSALGKFFKYIWQDIISPILQYVGGFFVAVGQLIAWCIQNVIIAAIKWLGDKWNWLYNNIILPVGNAIGNVFKAIGKWFSDMYNTYIVPIIQAFSAAWDWVKAVFMSVMAVLGAAWDSFVKVLVAIWNAYGKPFVDTVKAVWDVVRDTWNGAINKIKQGFEDFIAGIKKAWETIKSWLKFPHITMVGKWDLRPDSFSIPTLDVKWNAKGGIFTHPTLLGGNQGVGEAGAEAVIPLKSSVLAGIGKGISDNMPDNMDKALTTDNGVVIHVNGLTVREEADVERIGRELYKLQQRESRRLGRSGV